jgi:hypothetical protein
MGAAELLIDRVLSSHQNMPSKNPGESE